MKHEDSVPSYEDLLNQQSEDLIKKKTNFIDEKELNKLENELGNEEIIDIEDKPSKYLSGLIGHYQQYGNLLTNAPINFHTHEIIGVIGHKMGWNTIHPIQPKEVHFNMMQILVGKSGEKRKTTAQDIASEFVSSKKRMAKFFSPEGFLENLANEPESMMFYGEFSTILKHIKKGGYMNNIMEIFNDFITCPETIYKKLAKKEFVINKPFFTFNTTLTEEVLLDNLTLEMVVGGFLPRFIMVDGEQTRYRKREVVSDKAKKMKDEIHEMMDYIEREHHNEIYHIEFEFTEKALELFNEIDKELQTSKKWENVRPFANRISNYLICYSDILCESDLIYSIWREFKKNKENLPQLHNLTSNIDSQRILPLNSVTPKTVRTCEVVTKLPKMTYHESMWGDFIRLQVDETYVANAWRLLKPVGKFAKKIVKYVQQDKYLNKVEAVLNSRSPISHSDALRYTHLRTKQFCECIQTLKDRKTHFELEFWADNRKPSKFYCTRGRIGKSGCGRCRLSHYCTKDHREPPMEAY